MRIVEKKVVLKPESIACIHEIIRITYVPTNNHNVWLMKNHVTKADISSALYLRKDRMVSHLNRTRMRCQKPLAAFKKSSRVGRWTLGRDRASCRKNFE